MRGIFDFPAESAKIADWLADEAVWRELLSGSNSLINRERTGNSCDFRLDPSDRGPKS
jgi:hypothetical protein